MKRIGLVLLGMLLGVAVGVPVARSQSRLQPGLFVMGPDGTGYIVGAENRYPIAWTLDDGSNLDQLGDGGAIRSMQELLARLDATPASAPAPPPPPAPNPILFETSGQAGGQSDNFTVPGRVQFCWDVTGRSPSGTIGAEASFYIYPEGGGRGSYAASFNSRTDSGCTFANIPAGVYYIQVIATPWSRWRVTIRRP